MISGAASIRASSGMSLPHEGIRAELIRAGLTGRTADGHP
jgi:hypothetical protein